jgi:hypothetical protein
MASSRTVEEEHGSYTDQIRPRHNGYWAGDFSSRDLATSGATRPIRGSWR